MLTTQQVPGFLEKRPVVGLILAALAAAIVSALIYWAGYWWGKSAGADVDGQAEAYAGVVAGVLGTAVALGGSMVAIYLAAFAIRLQRLQNERDDRQAQVELLSMLTEQSGVFLGPYAQSMSSVRRIIGLLEINHEALWIHVEDATRVELAIVARLRPTLPRLAAEMRKLSEHLAALSQAANSNPFANAIFRHSFREQWQPTPAPKGGDVSLASLQSISLIVGANADRLEALAGESDKVIWDRVMVARMLAASSRDSHDPPERVQDSFVVLFLMFGYLAASGQFGDEDLQSGRPLRAPLCELMYLLAEAYTPETYRYGLEQLFAGNPGLSRTFATLGEFAPNPLDPATTQALDRYGALRPYFMWPPMRQSSPAPAA